MTRAAAPRSAAPRARSRPAPVKERATRQSPLRTKRKKERKLAWIGLLVLFFVLLGIIIYVLWLPALRVQAVEAEGPDQEGIAAVAMKTLEGRMYGLLPRDSIFLIPEKDIRAEVLDAYPQVQAVSISAVGLTTLKVKALTRTNAFVWCGESVSAPASVCYEADAEGLVFAAYQPSMASSTASSTGTLAHMLTDDGNIFVYGPLEGEGDSPVRKHVTYASALPGALKFIKAMRGLGADIGSVTLRGDEIDLHTKADTRITYVIGKEGEAAILAATSFPSLALNDGSIEYIDLRFQNKVYLKKRGAVE
ncbi:MAG: hypothetical protein AAB582_02025 [Patescibacteria group bacterium]